MAGGPATTSWSRPVRLFDANRTRQLLSALPTKAGVYRIRILDVDEQPMPVRRLKCDDPEGILDIGEAGDTKNTNLQWRVEAFQKAVLDGKTSHSAGLKFNHYRFEHLFRLHTLCVDWIIKADKKTARAWEEKLLEDHRRKFFDYPPLNCKA